MTFTDSDYNNSYFGLLCGPDASSTCAFGYWFVKESMLTEPTGSVGPEYPIVNDTTSPVITITNPQNISTPSSNLNVTTNEDTDWCGYNLGGANYTLFNSSMTNWFIEMAGLSDLTLYHLSVYCNDTSGNMGLNSSIWFTYSLVPVLPVVLDNPSDGSSFVQDVNFTMNGTLNCTQGNCSYVSVYPQYQVSSPDIWTISSSSEWNSGTIGDHGFVYDGNMTINHSLIFSVMKDTSSSPYLLFGSAAQTSALRVSDNEVIVIYQGRTIDISKYGTNGTIYYIGNSTFSGNIEISLWGQDGINQSHPHPRLDKINDEYTLYYGPYGYFWYKNSTDGIDWGDKDDKIQIWGGGSSTQDIEASQCQFVNDSTCYLCGRYYDGGNQELKLVIVNVNASHPNGYWASNMPNETIATGADGSFQSMASHWNGTDFFCYYRDSTGAGNLAYYWGTPETGWTLGDTGINTDTNSNTFTEDGYYWWTYREANDDCKIAIGTTATTANFLQQFSSDCQGHDLRPDPFDKYYYFMPYATESATQHIKMMELQRNITGNNTYISPVKDSTNNYTTWGNIQWVANVPSGSEMVVGFSVRNDTGESWSAWSTVTNNTDISLTGRYGRFQMVMNNTGNNYTSPTAESVNVSYDAGSWLEIISSSVLKTDSAVPYDCGLMTSATGSCIPSFNVSGTAVNSYAIRLYANSSEIDDGSDVVFISIFATPTPPVLQQYPILAVIPIVIVAFLLISLVGMITSGVFDVELLIITGIATIVAIVMIGVMYVV